MLDAAALERPDDGVVFDGLTRVADLELDHSTAVLLPDGRVLSAGDTGTGTLSGRNTVEIYSPPYISKGPRPTIVSAPTAVNNGATFTLTTDVPIARAVLMAPGATSHNDDMNQCHVELAITSGSTTTTAIVPSRNVAPPGWYMLFALDANGVPSIATWVQVS